MNVQSGSVQWTKLRNAVTRGLLALSGFAGLSLTANAQEAPRPVVPARPNAAAASATKPKAVPGAEESEKAAANDGANQGIKVHGHWVLQVKNADGTLGERREFNNSLVTAAGADGPSGATMLAGILSGNITVGPPAIGFVQGSPTGTVNYCSVSGNGLTGVSCYVFAASGSEWLIAAQVAPFPGPTGVVNVESGLTAIANFVNATIVLSGNYVVPAGLTSISGVQSLYGVCASINNQIGALGAQNSVVGQIVATQSSFGKIDATSCGSLDAHIWGPLTSTLLTSGTPPTLTPMAVTTGQVIQVTFTLSFS